MPTDRRSVRRSGLHAGVLVPWANSVVEAELPRRAGSSIIWHYARLVPPSRVTALGEDFLAGLLTAVPEALEELAALPISRAYLACTSAAFMLPGQAKTAIKDARIPVITAFDAIITLLRQLGAHRIVLLTPYPEWISEAEAEMFDTCGIVVVGHASLKLTDGYSEITAGKVRALARGVSGRAMEEAQAIVLSRTGWPTLGLVAGLQRRLGRKVISSNLAIVRHALMLNEVDSR